MQANSYDGVTFDSLLSYAQYILSYARIISWIVLLKPGIPFAGTSNSRPACNKSPLIIPGFDARATNISIFV